MPLQVTPVNRNLQTRVTFMYLEFEDLFVVLGAAAVMNVVGHFVGGEIASTANRVATFVIWRSGMRSRVPTVQCRRIAKSGRHICERSDGANHACPTREEAPRASIV